MERTTTVAEDRAEANARSRWENDQAFRDEHFSLDAAVGLAKAEARGHVKVMGGGVVRSPSKSATAAAVPGAPQAGAHPADNLGRQRIWNTSSTMRDKYGTYEKYLDWCHEQDRLRGR